MIVYKLKRLSDGKFYSGGGGWSKCGKAYSMRGHLTQAYNHYKSLLSFHLRRQPQNLIICIMTPTSYEEIPVEEFFNASV